MVVNNANSSIVTTYMILAAPLRSAASGVFGAMGAGSG